MIAHWMRWGVYALVPVWLVGMAFSYWFFQGQHQRMYLTLEQPESPLTIAANKVTVAHLWDAACICSKFNSAHVRALIKKYRQLGVDFVIVPRMHKGDDLQTVFTDIRNRFGSVRIEPGWYAKLSSYIPAAPAAAVFDQTGQASYIGPYSADLYCTSGNDGFVEKALNGMLASKNKRKFITPVVSGCFCPTGPKHESQRI